jgi:hypothetical protein
MKGSKLADIIDETTELIYASEGESLGAVLQLLKRHNILSCPVKSTKEDNRFIGAVDFVRE